MCKDDFWKGERTPQAETSSQRTARTRIQKLLENYFSNQGADTLILLLKESPEPGEKEFLIEGDFEK